MAVFPYPGVVRGLCMRQQPVNIQWSEEFRLIAVEECPEAIASWLTDRTSMTARLASYGQPITVTVTNEGYIPAQQLTVEERQAFTDQLDSQYWLREVQLLANGSPWLAGRTVIPHTSLNGPEAALKQLGTTPLGQHLFTSQVLSRDYLLAGKMGNWWARRSLLRLAAKPLLLTEIFLPNAPLYQ